MVNIKKRKEKKKETKKTPSFLGKFGPKNQNCQFKLKLGTQANSNMQNSMLVPTLYVLDWKRYFWANLVKKKHPF